MTNILFNRLIADMNKKITRNQKHDGRSQLRLMTDLVEAERRFKDLLIADPKGEDMYLAFIDFILNKKRNLLSCRIYFRERQDQFPNNLYTAMRDNDAKRLYKFNINYRFAKWMLDNYDGDNLIELKIALDEIGKIRQILCENNMPLVINQSKIFWAKNISSPIEFEDAIAASSEGLVNAIDKFVPNSGNSTLGSVSSNRMLSNMLNHHNITLVKLSPRERRVLYRANNAKVKAKLTEDGDILGYVNEKFPTIGLGQLRDIFQAITEVVNIDNEVAEGGLCIRNILPSSYESPENLLLLKEIIIKIGRVLGDLPPMQEKVFRLKHSFPNRKAMRYEK